MDPVPILVVPHPRERPSPFVRPTAPFNRRMHAQGKRHAMPWAGLADAVAGNLARASGSFRWSPALERRAESALCWLAIPVDRGKFAPDRRLERCNAAVKQRRRQIP